MRSSRVGVDARRAAARGASVSSSIVGYGDAGAPRRAPGAPSAAARARAPRRARAAAATSAANSSSSSTSGTSTSAPSRGGRRRGAARRRSRSRPRPSRPHRSGSAAAARAAAQTLFVARFVGDHAEPRPWAARSSAAAASGPLGSPAAGRRGARGGSRRRVRGRRRAGGRPGAGTGPPVDVVGGAGRRAPAARLLGLGAVGPPSTAACASSAPRIRTPSAGGDSGRSSSKSGTRSSGSLAPPG